MRILSLLILFFILSLVSYGREPVITAAVDVTVWAKIPGSSDSIFGGVTAQPGLETGGPPFRTVGIGDQSGYVARMTGDGELVFLRYLNGFPSIAQIHVDTRGSIWLLAIADGYSPSAPNSPPYYDLRSVFKRKLFDPEHWQYLIRIDAGDGHIISTTELGVVWNSIAADSKGQVWLGAVARNRLSTTDDAFEPRSPIGDAGNCCTGALARLSPNADRITYATYLGASRDGVHTLAFDAKDNLYVAGTRIWKFSPEPKLIWSTQMRPGLVTVSAIGPSDGDLFLGGCTTALVPVFYTSPWALQPTSTKSRPVVLPNVDPQYPSTCQDGFVTRFDSEGNLKYSTLIGGPSGDSIKAIQADDLGRALVVFVGGPPATGTRNIFHKGTGGGHIVRIRPDGDSVDFFSHYWGGSLTSPAFSRDGQQMDYLSVTFIDAQQGSNIYLLRHQFEEDLMKQPRIDDVVLDADPRLDYALEIRGEGFGPEGVAVTLDGHPLTVSKSSDVSITISRFTPTPPQSITRGNESLYQLRVSRADDGQVRDITLALRRRQ
jgi:hypothetical protein